MAYPSSVVVEEELIVSTVVVVVVHGASGISLHGLVFTTGNRKGIGNLVVGDSTATRKRGGIGNIGEQLSETEGST